MPCLSSSIRRVFGAWRRKAGDEESAPQGIELSEVWVEPIIEPPESYECDAKCGHIPNGEVLILGDGGVTIKIVVGRPPERTTFVAHKSLLRQHSEYFATALKDGNEDRFIEADRGVFEWPDDDPEQVRRWVRWLYTCRNCQRGDPYNSAHICKSGSELDRDPNSWCAPDVESELAYLLGDRLLSPGYCRFALGFFIQHVHLIEPDRILWAHERLPERSSLRRFVHAWLSWMNYRLDTGMKMTADERAAARALSYGWVAIDGSRTNDPRKYLPEHWSEPCSLHSNRLCNHERAHWFWRRSANGQPVSRCPTITRRITPDRRAACVGALVLLYVCCAAMLVLSAYVGAMDRQGLIEQPSKVFGVVTAVCAFFGTCFCGGWIPSLSIPVAIISCVAAVLSSQQASQCFQTATAETSICSVQSAFASAEIIYTLVLSGFILAWYNRRRSPH